MANASGAALTTIDPNPWSCLPFILLMLMMAFLPMTCGLPKKMWEPLWGKAAAVAFISFIVWMYICIAFSSLGGPQAMGSQLLDWISFVCLVGSLYCVAGGIYCDYDDIASPRLNTLFLLMGALLTNITGTTGACMILIRPFIHANKARLAPHHIAFFIMIVGNVGGVLTPLGDPPMFIGFLKGVPFFWMLLNPKIVGSWILCIASLLIAFYFHDRRNFRAYIASNDSVVSADASGHVVFRGRVAAMGFVAIVIVVFVQGLPIWGDAVNSRLVNLAASALLVAVTLGVRFVFGDRECYELNRFSLNPLLEVAILFFGLFSSLVPVLCYFEFHAAELNIVAPWQFFWASGALSAVLDNAPTYYTFASLGAGLYNASFNDPAQVSVLLTQPSFVKILTAVSIGSVFFGAVTYLGNAPNLMVKAIVEDILQTEGRDASKSVPNFLVYMLWVVPHLMPLFVVVTFIIG